MFYNFFDSFLAVHAVIYSIGFHYLFSYYFDSTKLPLFTIQNIVLYFCIELYKSIVCVSLNDLMKLGLRSRLISEFVVSAERRNMIPECFCGSLNSTQI
jgi:hypothetical protein